MIGASPRALRIWQSWFFLSVLFHHSNLRLPLGLEKRLARLFTTPRMHGIHHSAVEAETNSNWSSGLSIWDHLHATFRLDVPQDQVEIGVPGYRSPADTGLGRSLRLPFAQAPVERPAEPGTVGEGPRRLATGGRRAYLSGDVRFPPTRRLPVPPR
jgi:hypothetical protein